MAQLVVRLRITIQSLGNEGARANAHAELCRVAAAHAAVDRLEARLAATGTGALPLPDAA